MHGVHDTQGGMKEDTCVHWWSHTTHAGQESTILDEWEEVPLGEGGDHDHDPEACQS